MSRNRLAPTLFATLIACSACENEKISGPPERLPAPAYAILDALHGGGNPFFFFRAPLVPDPTSIPGTFDNTLLNQLRIEIYEIDGSGAVQGPAVDVLTSTSNPLERLRISSAGFYYALWNTLGVNPNINYQIQVHAGTRLLGSIDVDFVNRLRELQTIDRNNFAGWIPGLPLLIPFSIQQGALGNQAPSVQINSPASGATFAIGQSINFVGSGNDPEDGVLQGGSLVWTSDRDGQIGIGGTFTHSGLSAGTHQITLTGTDGSGESTRDQITITVTGNLPPIQLGNALVGSGLQTAVTGTLGSPAGTGGTRIRVTSSDPGILLVAPDAATMGSTFADIDVPAGQTTFTFFVEGVEGHTGSAGITADAPGYTAGSTTGVVVPPAIRINGLPASTNVLAGDLPFHIEIGIADANLSDLATAQNVAQTVQAIRVTVTVSDPNVVQLVTSGTQAGTAEIQIQPGMSTSKIQPSDIWVRLFRDGMATIEASAPNVITTAAAKRDLEVVNLPPSVRLLSPSPGQTFNAGETITFTAAGSDPEEGPLTSLTWTSNLDGQIGTGTTFTRNDLSPGIHLITVSGEDSHGLQAGAQIGITVVGTLSPITLNDNVVGSGLQVLMTGTLGAPAPQGGARVKVTSSDPGKILVSPDAFTTGSAEIDIVVPQGLSNFSYFAQAIEGQAGTGQVTATSSGYTSGAADLIIRTPVLQINNLPVTANTSVGDIPFHIQTGLPNTAGTDLAVAQSVRAGAMALTVTIGSSNSGIGQIVAPGTVGVTGQALIQPGQSTTSIAPSDLFLRPAGPGLLTVSAAATGFGSTGDRTIEFIAPNTITVPGLRVGAGLMSNIAFTTLGSPAPQGGLRVRLTSTDADIFRLSPDPNTAGTIFIDIDVPAGQSQVPFVLHTISPGTAQLIATAANFSDGVATQNVVAPTGRIVGLPSTAAPNSRNPFLVHTGTPTIDGLDFGEPHRVRTGGPPLTFTLVSSNAVVGRLATSAGTGSTAQLQVQPGQPSSPMLLQDGGIEFIAGDLTVVGSSVTIAISPLHGVAPVNQSRQVVTIQ
jgi:hypothetical protein